MKITQSNVVHSQAFLMQKQACLTSSQSRLLGPSSLTFRGEETLVPIKKPFSLGNYINNIKAKAIWKQIQNSDNIVILTHKFADGDAVSSGLALLQTIEEKFPNKKVEFYVPGKYPSFLGGLPGVGKILTKEPNFDKIGLAISVDCSKANMDGVGLFNKAKKRIKIDHHYSNEFNGLLSLVDKKAPSATSVIYNNLFKP